MGTWSLVVPTVTGSTTTISLADLEVSVKWVRASGLAPVALVAPGDIYQRTVAGRRELVLHGHTRQRELIAAKRKQLLASLGPALELETSVQLQYAGSARTLVLDCRFAGGLEDFSSDAINLHFVAFEPVTWRSAAQASQAKDHRGTVSGTNYIAQRSAAGVWNKLTGLNDAVNEIVPNLAGTVLYVGGAFTSPGAFVAQYSGGSFSAMGAGLAGECTCLAVGPDGSVYAGGSFNGVYKWNGVSWSLLAGGPNGFLEALVFDGDGNLYAGGSFTAPGNNVAKWNGSAWTALGAGCTGGRVSALRVGPDGKLYAGGLFTSPGTRVAVWNPATSTWGTLGSGMDAEVLGLVFGSDGTLYAAGRFSTAGGVAAARAAQWNGVAWRALGSGLAGGDAQVFGEDQLGLIYFGGNFTTAGGLVLADRAARWNGSVWLPVGVNLPGTAFLGGMHVSSAGVLTIGFNGAGDMVRPSVQTIATAGTAPTWPVLTVNGPGRINEFVNWTSGRALFTDLTLLSGEQAVLDLRPEARTFVSNFRGNVMGKIHPGSDVADWALLPGTNSVGLLVNNLAASATIAWYDRYWSLDEADAA